MPLLGNPTAAVLYPLKVVFALVPYAWGARLYIVAHTAVAFFAMLVLLRSWGTSWTGSGLSALAYAFGAPILFQSANVIYLVGAAWLPLGVHAVDQWVRRGRRWALIELAFVLSMQLLGGEPAVGLFPGTRGARLRGGAGVGASRRSPTRRRRREGAGIPVDPGLARRDRRLIGLAILWSVASVALGCWVPHFREHKLPAKPLPWMWIVPMLVAGAWGAAGLGFLAFWRRQGWRFPLGLASLGLAVAAGLAVAVSAAQLLPVLEFTQRTSRAAEGGPHEIYPFSLEPARLAGLIWPNVLGNAFDGNTSWSELVRPPGSVAHVWVPSIYLGGLTLVLALGTLALRRAAPWRVWLTIIVLISVCGSLGEYTSPIWAVRALAEGRRPFNRKLPDHNPGPREITIDMAKVSPTFRPLIRELGPLDPDDTTPIRQDDFLRDGDGGLYWLMTTVLPGFRQFRYPAKLFTLTSLGLAALAGIGWDTLGRGGSRRVTLVTAILLGITVLLLAGVVVRRQAIINLFGRDEHRLDLRSLGPARGLRCAGPRAGAGRGRAGAGIDRHPAGRQPAADRWTAGIAGDHRRPGPRQPAFRPDGPPVRFRDQARGLEAARGSRAGGPVSRPLPDPPLAVLGSDVLEPHRIPDRSLEIVQWERDTLQPKYGLPLGVEYAHIMGVAELYEYEWYYGGFPRTVRDPDMARVLNVAIGDPIVYFPRRSFDMWNARYFVVPMWPNGWNDSFRGYASMLLESETVYPRMREMQGPEGEEKAKEWTEKHDFRILRNRRATPGPGSSTRRESSSRRTASTPAPRGRRRCWRSAMRMILSGATIRSRPSTRTASSGSTGTSETR